MINFIRLSKPHGHRARAQDILVWINPAQIVSMEQVEGKVDTWLHMSNGEKYMATEQEANVIRISKGVNA